MIFEESGILLTAQKWRVSGGKPESLHQKPQKYTHDSFANARLASVQVGVFTKEDFIPVERYVKNAYRKTKEERYLIAVRR